jgi:hypothetical protein
MQTTLAAYRLLLVDSHNILKSITLAPAITYVLGFGALYGAGRFVRDTAGAVLPATRRSPS